MAASRCSTRPPRSRRLDTLEGDEKTGARIILRALEEPLRQLAYNAGLEGSVVVSQVRAAKKGQGLNVDTGEIEDLVKNGIIDPTMVTRSALQNAASIAKNILTTEVIVVDAPEKNGRRRWHARHGRHGRHDVERRGEASASPLHCFNSASAESVSQGPA